MSSVVDVTSTLTNIQNNTAKIQAERAAKSTGNTELGQDAFLQLLMAQLKNQDPLNPTDSSQFMSQQAQLTQVSELQKLNKTIASSNEMMQASALIGKNVSLTDPNNSDNIISGKVSEARIDSKGTNVVINGNSYPMDNIISIKEANTATNN